MLYGKQNLLSLFCLQGVGKGFIAAKNTSQHPRMKSATHYRYWLDRLGSRTRGSGAIAPNVLEKRVPPSVGPMAISVWPIPIFRSVRSDQYPYFGLVNTLKTAKPRTDVLYLVFKNIKRLRKTPDRCKIASVAPIYKKSDRRLDKNYPRVSLLNIDIKIFEKFSPLYEQFEKHLSKHQHGFVRSRSVTTILLSFLQNI